MVFLFYLFFSLFAARDGRNTFLPEGALLVGGFDHPAARTHTPAASGSPRSGRFTDGVCGLRGDYIPLRQVAAGLSSGAFRMPSNS